MEEAQNAEEEGGADLGIEAVARARRYVGCTPGDCRAALARRKRMVQQRVRAGARTGGLMMEF